MMRPLPVVLPPQPDELLSSWISRHGQFYSVPAQTLLQHCLPDATSLRATDLVLTADQEAQLASMFSTDPVVIRRMTFSNVVGPAHQFIASKQEHRCANCCSDHADQSVILRSQFLGWRIRCPQCGSRLEDINGCEVPTPFQQYDAAAVRGEKLLDDEAERGVRAWASSLEIARLLLMRRLKRPVPSEEDLWRFRVLGAIIPEFDHVIVNGGDLRPTPARPILPIPIRPALLAGVAIVERAGPEMLRMLNGHMLGQNKDRFSEASERMIAQSRGADSPAQMQLI